MFLRALVTWFGLLVAAVLNGMFREAVVAPQFGAAAAHVLSVLSGSAAIFLVVWLTIPWVRPVDLRDARAIGLLWLALTVAFEFLGGHFLFGAPWSQLLADDTILRGRLWLVVLAVVFTVPMLAAYGRGLIRKPQL